MSSDEQSDKECPLCMEAFDIDDFNFYPCNCQYQICRFCWHRIRTNENGLCPACRQSYPEDPVNFQPFSSAELQKIKSEKKQKIQQQKNKVVESRKHLSEFRVLQKNLVYAVGLSQRMADPELLKKPEFFGKFGRIIKVAVGTAQAINNSTPPTHTSYVTYARSEDALRAIQAVNNMVVDGRLLKASLGTTKYCSNFLKGQACYKPECMYLHEVAEEETSFTKEDMHQGKHTEYERRLHDQMMAVLGQQSNSAAGTQQQKEMLKNKTNRIAENFNEKKRQTTGSTENLVKMAQQKQKKGSAGNIGVSTAATTSGSTKCGWDEQKMSGTATTTTRGGSETRELRRNESAQAMVSDVKRNSKASVKSVSPPTISSAGLEDRSANSSSNNIAALNTSPISMQYSMADQPHQQQQQLVRSESNPPLMAASSVPSPSPPMMIPTAEMNGIGDEDTTLVMVAAAATDSNSMQLDILQEPEEKTLPPQSANSTINFFLDQDDGDLGFDPFAESARELEKIMEEEKQNMPSAADASSLTSHQHNGFGSASSASINNYFSNNNNSTLFNHNHQPHPPGLHPTFSGNGGLHSNNFDGGDGPSGFSSMFGSNKLMNSSERSIANSMSDLRESFKAMLPNVNVRFMSDSNNQLQQQQQPLTHQSHQHHNFGGFFDNSSTSSLPALPSGGQMRTAASNHFRQFGLEHPQQQQPHPSLFQQRIHHLQQQQQMQTQNHNHMAQNHHHPFQSMGSYGNGSNNTNGPFSGGMQQQQHQMAHQQQQSQPSQQSQYSQQQSTATAAALHRQQTSSSNHTHPFQSLQQQHFAMPPLQQQQQQHNSGGAGPFASQSIEQQQQTGSGGSSSWLPVPPGFSPR